MFKVRNRQIHNKVIRQRKAQPVVIEKIKNNLNIVETIKKIDDIEEILKPVDVTPQVIAPNILEPVVVDTEKILEGIAQDKNLRTDDGAVFDDEGNSITEDKPKKTRKSKTQKKETTEE